MPRRQLVLLVSRAVSVIFLVDATLDGLMLPERLVSLRHYTDRVDSLVATAQDVYFQRYDRIGIALLFARIAVLLLFGFIFWRCGPWVERVLLPDASNAGGSK